MKGGDVMKLGRLFIFILFTVFLMGCQNEHYEAIPEHEDFIASVNILEPSIDFINTSGDIFATWTFDEPYTGAILIGKSQLLLYGNQLEHASLISLKTGKLQQEIAVKKGITYAYYNDNENLFYLANGEYNTVTSYNEKGQQQQEKIVGIYPMAMTANDGQLYIVNFKDKYLSVLNAKSLEEMKRIDIPKFSHGLDFMKDELWIGGHGAGEKPNIEVQRIDVQSGKNIGQLQLPSMPIAFTKLNNQEFVLSHGENTLYQIDANYQVVWQKKIGSNPFAVNAFQSAVIVAGYDDQTLYWLKDHQIKHEIKVGKGPFQLLVREGK